MRLLFALLCLVGAIQAQLPSPYTFVCEEKRCIRKLKEASETATSMNVCKLSCDDDKGSLWPLPTGQISIGKELVSLHPDNITFVTTNPAPIQGMLDAAVDIFRSYIPQPQTPGSMQNKLEVQITVTEGTTDLRLSVEDEAYTLTMTTASAGGSATVSASITANTFFGARHALETLSQLIAYDEINDVLQVVSEVTVVDKPVFAYRGVMMDTARNYYSVDMIKKIIDGMSYNKLSVFHWHITDSQSFPMEIPMRPKMAQYGAAMPGKIYSVAAIKDVVQYARQRGIKVIPELDQPAHSGYGYQWGAQDGLGNLVVCVDSEPWFDFCVQPNCGQLNIVNDNVTTVVGDIFSDMFDMFDKDFFHMGGDEVDFRCYNSTKEITDWMTANGYSLERDGFFKLWGEFQEKLLQKLITASGRDDTQVLLWTSGLTDPAIIEEHLDNKRYIIQIWSDSSDPLIGGLLEKGYRTVFSNVDALYLDCGFQAWLGDGHNWCSPIKGWQTIYNNNPEAIYAKFSNDSVAGEAVRSGQIMGAETPLWAEQSDDQAVQSRIFPRGAAHAERLWSHPTTTHREAEVRMVTNRQRMVARGIAADRLQQEICLMYEGKCYSEADHNAEPTTSSQGKGDNSGATTTLPAAMLIVVTMTIANLFMRV